MKGKWWVGAAVTLVLLGCVARQAAAQPGLQMSVSQGSGPWGIQVQAGAPANPQQLTGLLRVFLLLTILSLAPAILIMCTSFTRIIIVLSFLRHALGVSNIPPNQILVAIALFLTFFNMQPVWQEIQSRAVSPYTAGTISWDQAGRRCLEPVRTFMLKQTRPKDLTLFVKLSRQNHRLKPAELPMVVIMPAFIISELRTAFQIGFLLYLPFLVIDMVVASILLSMGMMMLPPIMISLPFKILLFVMIDGWNLLVYSLLRSFR